MDSLSTMPAGKTAETPTCGNLAHLIARVENPHINPRELVVGLRHPRRVHITDDLDDFSMTVFRSPTRVCASMNVPLRRTMLTSRRGIRQPKAGVLVTLENMEDLADRHGICSPAIMAPATATPMG